VKKYKKHVKPTKTKIRVEGYLERKLKNTYSGGKHFAFKHGMSGLIALLVSSVIPMLEQWHSDKMYKDEIKSVGSDNSQQIKDLETRETKQIDDLKKDDKEMFTALWQALQNKKDKNDNKEYQ